MKAHKQQKIFFVSLFLFLLFGLSYYGWKTGLRVREIQLELTKDPAWESEAEKIQSLLRSRLKKFIGKNIFQVSLNDLMKAVSAEPRVGHVKVLRVFPNRFFIQASARKPLLVLLLKNKIHPLSMDGETLDPLPSHLIPDLPILTDQVFFKKMALRKKAIQFLSLLPEDGEFSRNEISEIKYSHLENSLIFILSESGKPIKVGFNPALLKTKRIESVLRYLKQKNIKWRVIDARFSQKIVVSTGKAI